MASWLGIVVPTAITAFVVAGFTLWDRVGALSVEHAELKQRFAEFSTECVHRRTRSDMDHQRLADCLRRVERIEGRLD
jgi:hypothetical protein